MPVDEVIDVDEVLPNVDGKPGAKTCERIEPRMMEEASSDCSSVSAAREMDAKAQEATKKQGMNGSERSTASKASETLIRAFSVLQKRVFQSGKSLTTVYHEAVGFKSMEDFLTTSHYLSDNAPLRRWTDVDGPDRVELCDLNGEGTRQISLPKAWLCSQATAALCAVPPSLAFFLVGAFPPAGYKPETTPMWHTVMCALGYFVTHAGVAHWLAYTDSHLSTCTWYAYYIGWNSIFTLGLRLLVESTVSLPCSVYVIFLLCPYPFLDNPWHAALARIIGEASWYNPLIWLGSRMRPYFVFALIHEGTYFVASMIGILTPLAFLILDLYAFPPSLRKGNLAVMLGRPFIGWCVIKAAYASCCLGLKQTVCPWAKFYPFFFIYLAVSGVKARLFAGANGVSAILFVLAFDWVFFIFAVCNYWAATSPKRPSYTGIIRLYINTMTYEKVVPPPELRGADYRSYEMFVKHTSLLAAYLILIYGYGWQRLLNLQPTSPAVKFWFPRGYSSVAQLFVGLGSASLQNLVVHITVRFASRRYTPACDFGKLFPGWLYHPQAPVKTFLTSTFGFAFFTQLAFALEQDYPEVFRM